MTPRSSSRPKILTPANVIVAVLLVALFVGSCVALWAAAQDSSPASNDAAPMGTDADLRVVVHDSNGDAHELPLGEDTMVEIATDKGRNTVLVEDGTVRVTYADCENQDCIKQGALCAPGKQIICLPHELWIEVVDANEDGDAANRSIDTLSR